MAATLVGGAFLSASVQTILEKLSSTELRDYIRSNKLNESFLGDLKTTLFALQSVLDDAEEKQIYNSAVKQWLDDLKDAIYDAEDLLNKISTDSLHMEPQRVTNQVWNLLSSPFKSFYGEINSQMENMCARMQLFVQQRDILRLQTVSARVSRGAPTTSLVNESVMVGRNDEKEKLINMLLSDSTASATRNGNPGVVAIVGLGGVGKTTLAQLLYQDKRVQQHFDLKAWACVSEDFDIVGVTKTLVEHVTSKTYASSNLDSLQVELKKNLSDKRFLFVLDDLWNENYNDWDVLQTPLIEGKNGSKVIITTRQHKVAEMTHTFPIQKLEPLSDEDCWSILSKHAFGSVALGDNYPGLETIGKNITKKCGGLPIAAKALGGLMRSNVDEDEWSKILNNNIWDLRNNDILPALRLSYQYLPSHLKRCFAYCSIFPKDYSIDRKQLVLLWMAEGFIQKSQCKKELEEIGDDYFDELLSRSLFQQSGGSADRNKYFMHDLVNDLAAVVSGKCCRRLECGDISEKVRHLSYNQEVYDIHKKFDIFYKLKCLRSFLPLAHKWNYANYLSKKVVHDLLPSFSLLRVLSLARYKNVTMLPNLIGSLVQLRYLDLSCTRIRNLPDTTCKLHHLQTLNLSRCRSLRELPMRIGNLVNLRHLDINWTNIMELPMQILELENLQTLTVFAVGKQQVGLNVRELRKFPHLKGELSLRNLHNVIEAMDAYDANLKSKEKIEDLKLIWGGPADDSQTVNAVLGQLQPSTKLKTLGIHNFGGTIFPSWLGDSSFSHMVFLRITNCQYCVTLPALGQLPSLKELYITEMMSLETIGPEFLGTSISSSKPFPSLEYLEFRNLPNWKEWLPFESGESPFPRLETMVLSDCPELIGHLPNHLACIEHITIEGCDHLLATPPTQHWLSSIKFIKIEGGTQWQFLGSDSPSLVQEVYVQNCSNLLTSLPKIVLSSTSLRKLSLYKISSLTAFPSNGLPTSLKSLDIFKCGNLAFLPCETWCNYTSLVRLDIWNSCHSLTSFSLDGFPALQHLLFYKCRSLESISVSQSSSLQPLSLLSLHVDYCIAFRSLPKRMDTLTTLKRLTLCKLPDLELAFFEETSLPPKLQSIHIDIKGLPPKGVTQWGLQLLRTLAYLKIGGDDVVIALLREQLLPISLVSLTICSLSNIKSLEGNGLQHLTSLKVLRFLNCPSLESLLKERLPSSLEKLELCHCPRLESLPVHKLPSSLMYLSINHCRILQARYESQRGEQCPIIAQTLVLQINDEVTI